MSVKLKANGKQSETKRGFKNNSPAHTESSTNNVQSVFLTNPNAAIKILDADLSENPNSEKLKNMLMNLVGQAITLRKRGPIRTAFEVASKRDLLSKKHCSQLISYFGKSKDPESTFNVLMHARKNGITDDSQYLGAFYTLHTCGHPDKAHAVSKIALRSNPSPKLHFRFFSLMLKLGLKQLAMETLDSAMSIPKKELFIKMACGKLLELSKKGSAQAALEYANDLELAGILNSRISQARIKSYVELGDLDSAFAAYTQARDSDRLDKYGVSILANALFKRRKYSEASLVFQEATKLGLLDEKLYSTALNSYSRSGKIEQMRKTFQAALETGHADGQIFHIMMMSEARLDNLESAQNLLEIALGRGIADEKIFGGMALSFLKQRRSEDASRIFDMALNSGKVDRYLFDLMIPTCMKFSAIAQARHAWDKAMELDLGAAHKYGPELLNHYLDNQQWEDAITVYEQLKESKLPNIVHDYSHSMILAYGELGDLESAKSIYFRRVRKKKADSRTFNAMITVFKNAGLLEDMGRSYRRAVERGMANEETHRLVEGINGSD